MVSTLIAWKTQTMPYKRKRSSSRSRRPFRKSRRGKRSLKRTVSRILNRKIETKQYSFGAQNIELYHNIGSLPAAGALPTSDAVFFNPWLDISQGVGSYQRTGNEIMPVGMSLKIMLHNKGDRPNLYYRIIVAKLPKMTGGAITSRNNLQIFEPTNQGTLGGYMIQPLNKDLGVKAYYDKLIRLQGNNTWNQAGGKEISKIIKIWIKRKRSGKIIYDQAQNTIVNNPLALYVIPYDAFGTLTTDNIASYQYHCKLYYKDP